MSIYQVTRDVLGHLFPVSWPHFAKSQGQGTSALSEPEVASLAEFPAPSSVAHVVGLLTWALLSLPLLANCSVGLRRPLLPPQHSWSHTRKDMPPLCSLLHAVQPAGQPAALVHFTFSSFVCHDTGACLQGFPLPLSHLPSRDVSPHVITRLSPSATFTSPPFCYLSIS